MDGGNNFPTEPLPPANPPPPPADDTWGSTDDQEFLCLNDQVLDEDFPTELLPPANPPPSEEGYVTDPRAEYKPPEEEETDEAGRSFPPPIVHPANPPVGEPEKDPYDFDEDWCFKDALRKFCRQQRRECEGYVFSSDSSNYSDDLD